MSGVRTQRVSTKRIREHWPPILQIAGSLSERKASAREVVRPLRGTGRPSELARVISDIGRVFKTLHLLPYAGDDDYRRAITLQLNRSEHRHALARVLFFGRRGRRYQAYRVGQEDQLGALGLATNVLVLWNTRYLDVAARELDRLGLPADDADIARLSPLRWGHINMLWRYRFRLPPELTSGQLRPLRGSE